MENAANLGSKTFGLMLALGSRVLTGNSARNSTRGADSRREQGDTATLTGHVASDAVTGRYPEAAQSVQVTEPTSDTAEAMLDRHRSFYFAQMERKQALFNLAGFTYDAVSGVLFLNGVPHGYKRQDGYLVAKRPSGRVPVHRLAWRLHFGHWPTELIDHINGNRADNRIANLREAGFASNVQNSVRRRNQSGGERGVTFELTRAKWRVRIAADSKSFQFYASHRVSAILAARLIRRLLHGEFARQAT